MNTKSLATFLSMLLLVAGLISCSRSRSDADITSDVQAKIQSDTTLAAAPINVQCSSGVVVLSGTVPNEDTRNSAENAVRQVTGVKDVINNLQVATAAAPSARPRYTAQARTEQQSAKPDAAEMKSKPAAQAQAALAVKPVELVTIPEGTNLSIRLIDPVDTATNKEGDTFRGSLDAPIIIQDKTVIPKNADVETRLVSAKSAGHFTGSSSVALVVSKITVGKKTYEVQTGAFTKQGASRGKRSAMVIGGGAAAGALIGGLTGGGKGAAIGAAAGAGAGTGVQALTKAEQIKLPAETLLEFQLKSPLSVTPILDTAKRETIGD